jgi:hypothetical protein
MRSLAIRGKNLASNDVRSILRRGTSHAYAEVDFTGKDKHHSRRVGKKPYIKKKMLLNPTQTP